MSQDERDRLDVLSRVKRKELKVTEAAVLLGLSLRQTRRVWKRFRTSGSAGLVHAARGRASNNRLDDAVRDRIIKRHQAVYADFGHTHACQKLAEEGLVISPDTLVNLLKERELFVPKRKRSKHRKRRERRACFGQMVQCDGSVHDWFEGRGGPGLRATLMVLVDDATGITYARFYPAETTEASFDVFERWAQMYGIPREFYVDRHTIYRNNEHPDKPTQFARAMGELGVTLICANSPQAKGRVERRHAVFQDRLVKEMRLRGIRTLDQANAYLEQAFLKQINDAYAITARKKADVHRPVPSEIERVLCRMEERVVGRDWCVSWDGRVLQIASSHASLMLPGRRVTIRQSRTGVLQLSFKTQPLTFSELAAKPKTKTKSKRVIVNNRRWTPPTTHPWKTRPASLRKAG